MAANKTNKNIQFNKLIQVEFNKIQIIMKILKNLAMIKVSIKMNC